ncbi:MAG TPA: heme-degrading domain-containing protein [Devosiaceae bacterium]|jgi:uncharacterized protein (UPF0303 family)
MNAKADIALIAEQEETLVFSRFDETSAFAIGSLIRERGLSENLPIVCYIALWDRPLLYVTLPGTTGDNWDWVRRKANTVRRFHKSTYRLVLEQLPRTDRLLPEHRALPAEDYVLAGGGFPIMASGIGAIGAIVVSGLQERDDHSVVVEAICEFLGRDKVALGLPKE